MAEEQNQGALDKVLGGLGGVASAYKDLASGDLYGNIESIVNGIAGRDEAYANELKSEVGNVLGYQNFKARQGKYQDITNIPDLQSGAGAMDFTPNLHGDIDPSTVKEQVSTNLGMRLDEAEFQGSLAKKRLSAAKKAKEEALKTALDFQSEDWLDSEIKGYMISPFKEDGTRKTVEELKEELKGQLIGEADVTPDMTNADIEQRINDRLPQSWVDEKATEEEKMTDYYRMLGYTETESFDLYQLDRYKNNEMADIEKEIFSIKNPTLIQRAEKMEQYPELERDLNNPDGLLPYEELKMKYPDLSNEELADVAKPYYKKEVEKVINGVINDDPSIKEDAQSMTYAEFKKEYLADLLDKATLEYSGSLTRTEIEQIFYRKIFGE